MATPRGLGSQTPRYMKASTSMPRVPTLNNTPRGNRGSQPNISRMMTGTNRGQGNAGLKGMSMDSYNAQRDAKTVSDHASVNSRLVNGAKLQGYRAGMNNQAGGSNQSDMRENVAGPFSHYSATGHTSQYY